ncbi:MAG: CBS domain-containing protein, partial [Nitrososphaeraceae archaeon]
FPLLTIDANASVEQAVDIMIQNGVRHLLVIENNDVYKPLGIITPSDFTKYLKANLDIDDLNAKILQSMEEEQQKEESKSKSTKKAIINKTDSSQQKWPGT